MNDRYPVHFSVSVFVVVVWQRVMKEKSEEEREKEVWLGRFCSGKLVKVASVPKNLLFFVCVHDRELYIQLLLFLFFVVFYFWFFALLLSFITVRPSAPFQFHFLVFVSTSFLGAPFFIWIGNGT